MSSYLQKKKVKEALKKAKELEKKKIMTPEQEAELQKNAVSLSEKLRKLLAPEWFVKDVHKKRKVKKAVKKAKKKKARKKLKKKTKKARKKAGKQTKKKK